jgi:hypothetical protein
MKRKFALTMSLTICSLQRSLFWACEAKLEISITLIIRNFLRNGSLDTLKSNGKKNPEIEIQKQGAERRKEKKRRKEQNLLKWSSEHNIKRSAEEVSKMISFRSIRIIG